MVPPWVCLTFAIVFSPGCRGAWCNSNQYMPIVDVRFWKGHTQVSPKCLIIGCWLVSFNDSRNRNMSLHILIASPHVIFCGWTSGWIFLGAFQACAAVSCVHAVLSVVSCVCCVVCRSTLTPSWPCLHAFSVPKTHFKMSGAFFYHTTRGFPPLVSKTRSFCCVSLKKVTVGVSFTKY